MSKPIGRNDPCPCGSGKKYKRCCLNDPFLKSVTLLEPDAAVGRCAWCAMPMGEEERVVVLGAAGRPDMKLDVLAGEAIRLDLPDSDRKVPVIVSGRDSDARREGHELLFGTCGPECALLLTEALSAELQITARGVSGAGLAE